MQSRMTAETPPQSLLELIAYQRPRGMPGLEDHEFIDIVRELFAERAAIIEYDGNLPRRQAEAKAAECVDAFLRIIRMAMEKYAAETSPWHAREWFLMAYEEHQGEDDDE